MTDKQEQNVSTEEAGAGFKLNIVQQYVKSLNFNNAGAVNLATGKLNVGEMPNVNVNIVAEAKDLGINNAYEVVIKVNASAVVPSTSVVLFDLDISYGAVISIVNISPKDLEPILLIYCPSITFPFVRRVVSDITRDSGFPPLMLEIVDFAALYHNSRKKTA